MSTYTSQVQILHFSDLHFGDHHICNPAPSASKAGMPSLGKLISKDLLVDFGATVTDGTDYPSPTLLPMLTIIKVPPTHTHSPRLGLLTSRPSIRKL